MSIEDKLRSARRECLKTLYNSTRDYPVNIDWIREISDVHSWLCIEHSRYIRNRFVNDKRCVNRDYVVYK